MASRARSRRRLKSSTSRLTVQRYDIRTITSRPGLTPIAAPTWRLVQEEGMSQKVGLRLPGPRLLAAAAAVAVLTAVMSGAQPVAAAPGDVIADIVVPEVYVNGSYGIAKAVAYDGHNLYYAEFGGSTLHRIDMPPPGGPNQVTGHTDIPIIGAIGGIMTIAYDVGPDK